MYFVVILDTYVILSYFAYLMIIWNKIPGVRIHQKKLRQASISAKLQSTKDLFWGLKTSEDGASQKEVPGGARWAPHPSLARPKVGPRPARVWPPGSTLGAPLSRISPPQET